MDRQRNSGNPSALQLCLDEMNTVTSSNVTKLSGLQ